jgi:hypothetical protein
MGHTVFQSAWLGGVNGTNLTGWQWTDASTWDYTNWAIGQPDDSRSIEQFDYGAVVDANMLDRPF